MFRNTEHKQRAAPHRWPFVRVITKYSVGGLVSFMEHTLLVGSRFVSAAILDDDAEK